MWRNIATLIARTSRSRSVVTVAQLPVRKLAAANPLSVLMMNHLWSHS